MMRNSADVEERRDSCGLPLFQGSSYPRERGTTNNGYADQRGTTRQARGGRGVTFG